MRKDIFITGAPVQNINNNNHSFSVSCEEVIDEEDFDDPQDDNGESNFTHEECVISNNIVSVDDQSSTDSLFYGIEGHREIAYNISRNSNNNNYNKGTSESAKVISFLNQKINLAKKNFFRNALPDSQFDVDVPLLHPVDICNDGDDYEFSEYYGAIIERNNIDSDEKVNAIVFSEYQSFKNWIFMILQVVFALLIATVGQICAGFVLNVVQNLSSFRHIPHLIIMIPTLLGLKGNLEMTLVSRLTTALSLQHENPASKKSLVVANLILVQVQALIVSFIAVVVALIIGASTNQHIDIIKVTILISASLLAASVSVGILGALMSAIVIFSPYLNINPDNIATPIAASLGDVNTLVIFGLTCQSMSALAYGGYEWIVTVIAIALLGLIPVWTLVAMRNEFSKIMLTKGWIPIILSMLISSSAGILLESVMARYPELTVFIPVINGIGGNFGALNASKLSTIVNFTRNKVKMFIRCALYSCLNLQFLVLPVTLVALVILQEIDSIKIPKRLLLAFVMCAEVQIFILLVLGSLSVYFAEKLKLNPDNTVIPYVTSCGDFIGSGLLLLSFQFFVLQ